MKIDSIMGKLCESNYPEHGTFGSWCKAYEVQRLESRVGYLIEVCKAFLDCQQRNLDGTFDVAENFGYYIRIKSAVEDLEAL